MAERFEVKKIDSSICICNFPWAGSCKSCVAKGAEQFEIVECEVCIGDGYIADGEDEGKDCPACDGIGCWKKVK
jgi:hypothetical protein